MREAFRLQKSEIYAHLPKNTAVDLVWLYRDVAVAEYHVVCAAVAKSISKLREASERYSPTLKEVDIRHDFNT